MIKKANLSAVFFVMFCAVVCANAQEKMFELKYKSEIIKIQPARDMGFFSSLGEDVKEQKHELTGNYKILSFINANEKIYNDKSLWKGAGAIDLMDIVKISVVKTVIIKKYLLPGKLSRINGLKYVKSKITGYSLELESKTKELLSTDILKESIYIPSVADYLKIEGLALTDLQQEKFNQYKTGLESQLTQTGRV